LKELRKQVNRLIQAGVHGLFALGTNGEFYALSEEEKLEVLRVVIEEANGRVPVYAGTGCIGTEETIRFSLKAIELGADALTVISPYFVAVSQEDLYYHFKRIAESVDAPILLYNIPARTGNNIEFTTVKKLSNCPNIVGIKDSSGNFDNTLRYIEDTEERLSVLSGNDSLILWTLLAGGRGAVAGTSNVFPEKVVGIYEAWKRGDLEEAKKLQRALRPLRDVMKLGNPNTVIKRAMELLGYEVGPARNPVEARNPRMDEELKKVLQVETNKALGG
ncbi:MAG: 4-hydroxy-tetrahydrodipicolinate synthase, partial [Spirochaetes bacterium]|nr:4-hydroxy-tetrahydrodipicolinate synthase [Spirochaetota bacterium]